MTKSLNRSASLPRRLGPQMLAASCLVSALLLTSCSSNPSGENSSGASSNASSVPSASAPAPSASASASSAAASAAASAQPNSTSQATAETALKELVAGFPTKLIPLIKGGQVQTSSILRGTPLTTVSLVSSVTAKPADVLSYYTKVFTDQGFKAQPGDSVQGVPLKTFVRANGQEVVTVSIVATGQTSTLTVGANVLPASLK